MLIPAFVAVAATLVATGLTLGISGNAASRLRAVEEKDFPVLRFYQQMFDDLKEVHLLLKIVGESEDFTRITETDELHSGIANYIQGEGQLAVGKAESDKVLADFETYYQAAHALAAKRVQAELKKKAAIAGTKNDIHVHSNVTPEATAIATEIQEIDNAYKDLSDAFEQKKVEASRTMTSGMARARAVQFQSIVLGAFILLAAALLASAAAWLVAVRASRPLQTLSEAALRIAAGDLTQEVRVETADEVGILAGSFQRMVTRLRQLVGTLKDASQELALAAEQLSDHTRAQSAMLERQASGVAETSSTTRELEQTSSVAASRAASVLDVARRAADMSQAGQQAAERSAGELERIQVSVDSIVDQSSHLLEQARQVGDIVETVRDLATQSHVLSLNASIEAVKAGEAGKSFGVVAQEVRALAEQSGQSAATIGKMVEDILTAVQSTRETTERGSRGMAGSLGQIRASGDSLREIGTIVRETSDAALQIASAFQQQSTGIGQIATAMRDLNQGMEETIGRIRALELSSQHVAETATRISGIANEFTV
jgi:methyl-accepting chemotaxis protein